MYLNFVTGNVLQKFCSGAKNIIFYPQNNLFDHSLFELANNYYIFNDNKISYNIPNVIDLPKSYISLYNYNLSITSNIIGYSTSNIKKFHVNSIICTHSYRPHFIKKEDASILENNLSNEYKVFFTQGSCESWNIRNKSMVVRYGIPTKFLVKNTDRPKDILILNFDKAIHNEQLTQVLRSNKYTCDTLDSCQISTEKLNDIFNEYKICIDLAEHNIINLICAVAAGCQTITLKTQMLAEEYSDISGLHLVDSPSDILLSIPSLLNNADANNNSNQIIQSFNYDTFAQSINSLIEQTNKEAFLL